MKLQFKQKNYKEMMVTYKVMLTYIKCAHAHRSALALSSPHCTPRGAPGSQGYDPKQTRAKLGLPLVAPTNVSHTKRRI